MVDNFDIIRSLLKFENTGDCYYVQLLRRQKDDPMIDGKKDKSYHGNMHSRSIKDYFIMSLDMFDEKKEEIKQLCKMFNVRAYIRLNRRNYKAISLEILSHIVEEVKNGDTYASPFHLISSAAGLSNSEKEKTWLIDLDEEYLKYEQNIIDMISNCKPYPKNILSLHTKTGKHLIVRPFNSIEYLKFWNNFTKDNGIELAYPTIHKDNPTILYVI